MKLNKGEYITLYLKGDNIMLKMSNLFKNNEYEALFRFAYAPEKFIKIDDFNFDEFKNEIIAGICKDVVIDLKYGDYTTRLKRRPRISFEECFKSKEHMIVFFLLFGFDFSIRVHGCGDFKENILEITESTEDITELAVAWKRKMFSIIDSLKDLSVEQKVFAKTSVIELWRTMNILEAPEEDLEDLAYVD
jgi:hypothetical protein